MQEETTFVDVDAFGRSAETIGQYLKKGRPIMIEGRLRLDQWEDKNSGQKRSKLNVVLETFQFLDSGRSDDQSGGGGGGGNYSGGGQAASGRVSRPAPEVQNDPDSLPADDDVPF
jgi:single-strand DNA-binding protein